MPEYTTVPNLTEQPDYGERQVKRVGQIKRGMTLIRHRADSSESIIAILVYTSIQSGRLYLRYVKGADARDARVLDLRLEDYSVVPYKDGTWNPINWLEIEKMP